MPVHEAERIVAAVRAHGSPAEPVPFPNDGHLMQRESAQVRACPATGN